jgi:hypothetical protein
LLPQDTRERALDWLAAALNSNLERTKMQVRLAAALGLLKPLYLCCANLTGNAVTLQG